MTFAAATVCLLLLPLLTSPVASQSTTSNYQRQFYAWIDLSEVAKIDGVEQTFFVDFFYTIYYQEPLLTADQGNWSSDVVMIDSRIKSILDGRIPNPSFVNQRSITAEGSAMTMAFRGRPRGIRNVTVVNELPGVPWVGYSERYLGHFKARLELRDFPYDSQKVEVIVEEHAFQNAEAVFLDPLQAYKGNRFLDRVEEVIGWKPLEESAQISVQDYPSWGTDHSRLAISIRMERRPDFYINKIVTGVVLLVLMSHMTFVLDIKDSNRAVGSLTCFLGIVTYMFVISGDVPKVAYTTRLDRFVNLSFYMIFINYICHMALYLIGSYAAKKEEKAKEDCEEENRRLQRAGGSGGGLLKAAPRRQTPADPYLSSDDTASSAAGQEQSEQQQQHRNPTKSLARVNRPPTVMVPPTTPGERGDIPLADMNQRGGGDEHPGEQQMPEEEPVKPVVGWWTRWLRVRTVVDYCLMAALVSVYAIATAIVLTHM